MNNRDYIRHFLHDTDGTRWSDDYLDYLINIAKSELKTRANFFLNERKILREKAKLNRLETEDKTIEIKLENNKGEYDLPEFLQIKSVKYGNSFIAHDYMLNNEMTTDSTVKCYNVEGLEKGKLLISPIPRNIIKIANNQLEEFRDEFSYDCEVSILDDENKPIIINDSEFIKLSELNMYGWGLFGEISPLNIQLSNELKTDTLHKSVETNDDSFIEIDLGSLLVTYQIIKPIEFDDNDDEVIEKLINNDSLIKNYVCSVLLRSDEDSKSINIGMQEFELFNNGIDIILNSYKENYEIDSKLVLKNHENFDININTKVIQSGLIDLEKEKLDLQNKKLKLEDNSLDVEFSKLNVDKQLVKEKQNKLKSRNCKPRFDTINIRRI